jgi:hypothetical protein
MNKPKFLILLTLLLWNLNSWSQKWNTITKDQDTVKFKATQILVTKDTFFFSTMDTFAVLKKSEKYRIKINPYARSDVFFDSLQVKSYKNRITRELYQFIIKSTPIEVQDTSNFDKSESVFLKYKGLKIRNIRIIKVDVIEGSVHDTLVIAQSFLGKVANNVHLNTKDYVIYNNLTIKEGELVDPIKLADNERVLRNYPYIEDARIIIEQIPSDPSQVDLLILSKDKISMGVGSDFSGINNFKTYLYDKNFFGVGQEMRHYLIYRKGYDPQYGYAFRYKVNNILNTFISLRIDYENSWDRKYKGVSINKEFITQQTKYAGGISLYELADSREYQIKDSILLVPYKTINQDYWLGRAFFLNKNEGITLNSSFRFANANFLKRPYVSQDTNYFYHDRSLFLANFSLIQLKYYLSSRVYGFGVTEDIPYGCKFNILIGFEKDQFVNRPYIGGGISFGKHFKYPGYLLFNLEYGSYYSNGETQDRVLKFRLLNIGNLYHLSRYSLRPFFNIDFQSGRNMSDPDSKAVINGRWTSIVSGLKKEGLKGQEKLTLNFESVLFTPWYWLGFKFAMLSYIDLGWVSQQELLKKNPSFYGNVGVGVRIKNESWIFETITLGFAYFLSAPAGSSRMGFIFDGSDPRLFRNLNPGKPDIIRLDQSPELFLE